MIGLWTGNVRSTPTPKLTFRTVNDSRTPSPAREITTPANTWIRERFPSTTLTWTLTVSPGRKVGTSWRSDAELAALQTPSGQAHPTRAGPRPHPAENQLPAPLLRARSRESAATPHPP